MSDSLACLKSGSSGASITMTSDWYLLLQAVDEHAACMKKLMTLTRGKPAGQGGYLPGCCKELVLPFIVSGMLLIKPSRRAPGDRAVTEEALYRTRLLILAVPVAALLYFFTQPTLAGSAEPAHEIFLQALAHPDRPQQDRNQDIFRKPVEILELAGIRPGMKVADLMAGQGWYTEILARSVGHEGLVYAHNNKISDRPYGKALRQRLHESGLDNVVQLVSDLENPGLPSAELDAVYLVQFYHDTIWMNVDRAAMNSNIYEALKPGGVFVLIDHRALPDTGGSVSKTLHRVDPNLVLEEAQLAGFGLMQSSDLLQNLQDDHNLNVFDPAIRGRTDRFVFIFRKPP
jgi:predicted methyltransferase